MTSCYTVCHLFGKIHQNKAAAPLLTSRNEGNVLSAPPLETHGRALRVICHCWQVFYAVLGGPVAQHVLWHTPGCVATLKSLSLPFVSCQSVFGPVWWNSPNAVAQKTTPGNMGPGRRCALGSRPGGHVPCCFLYCGSLCNCVVFYHTESELESKLKAFFLPRLCFNNRFISTASRSLVFSMAVYRTTVILWIIFHFIS